MAARGTSNLMQRMAFDEAPGDDQATAEVRDLLHVVCLLF